MIVRLQDRGQLDGSAGSGGGIVEANARRSLDAYLSDRYRIGRAITRQDLKDALSVEGVEDVAIGEPTDNVDVASDQIALLSGDPVLTTVVES